jgi:hypothetical protein
MYSGMKMETKEDITSPPNQVLSTLTLKTKTQEITVNDSGFSAVGRRFCKCNI